MLAYKQVQANSLSVDEALGQDLHGHGGNPGNVENVQEMCEILIGADCHRQSSSRDR